MANIDAKYRGIVSRIYLFLPFTLLKQRFFFRLRKPPQGLPDFLCIGAQKAGTTWLYDQLKDHPEICLASIKEVHYFDWNFYRRFSWYLKHFNCPPGKLRGEITPGYSIIEKGRIRFIKRTMPGTKLILLLRDPRERAWSGARFHFGKELGRNIAEVSEEEFIRYFKRSWVQKRGDYETILQNWTDIFPGEQLLVVYTESIAADPAKALKKIVTFLNIAEVETGNIAARSNESGSRPMPEKIRKYLDGYYLPEMEKMKDVLKAYGELPWKF